MPPPHLHPRSRMTSSLFATTVLASFLVVALPHILPCPAPRRAYADGGDMAMQEQQQENTRVVRRASLYIKRLLQDHVMNGRLTVPRISDEG
ncbi:uncharacterized protein B0H64DRAFT_443904 [Chaetomium fimeti]|uniref:Uncharacterized protein n=1 Tax=Chaetomium fimeti TaxID=1854472 RepID=A0AAE0HEE9_9PEZI|nr:hypothetical protein B0H64DRAFT_443904 [Chaetomium fimeti]